MLTSSTLTPLAREALLIRHNAAMRLLRSDPELTPEEALLMVVAPGAELRRISEEEARRRREDARDYGCSKCHSACDDDGCCPMCGAVTLAAATA